MAFSIKISAWSAGQPGTKRLQEKFSKLAFSVRDRRPLMKRIGVLLLNEVSKNFETESHEGTPWKELAPLTIRRRRIGLGAGSPKILQDTGTLKRSFVMQPTRDTVVVGVPNKTVIVDGKKLNLQYAEHHEEGKGNTPKRKMLPSERRALGVAVDEAEDYVEESIKGAKL